MNRHLGPILGIGITALGLTMAISMPPGAASGALDRRIMLDIQGRDQIEAAGDPGAEAQGVQGGSISAGGISVRVSGREHSTTRAPLA